MPTEPDFDAVAILRALNRCDVDYVVVGGLRYRDLLPAQLVEVDGERVQIATKDHLRAMKTGTGRAKDAVDLEELSAADNE